VALVKEKMAMIFCWYHDRFFWWAILWYLCFVPLKRTR